MLGATDQKEQNFLMVLRKQGGVVKTVDANATAQALIA